MRCRVVFNLKSEIKFRIRNGEQEDADELIESIQNGYTPAWIEELIRKGIKWDEIDIEDKEIIGTEPAPDEELNFDY